MALATPVTPDAATGSGSLDVRLRNVSLSFPRPDNAGRLSIYENFTLEVERGSFTVLLGPSGCGKSTLLNIVDGLLTPTSADTLEVLGRDLRQDDDVTRHVAYVFQSPRLLPWLTLRKNVRLALKGLGTQPRAAWDDLIRRYFAVAGLEEYLDYYPHQVSGGMQQRVAIVRAWVNEPRILLMDEPFSHLDEITAAELRRALIELWTQDEQRRTVLFVTHDINEAVALGTHIVMLTPRPAEICYEQSVDIPWPRHGYDERVIELERELRRILAERAGVEV